MKTHLILLLTASLMMPLIVNSKDLSIDELKKNVEIKKSGSHIIRRVPSVSAKRNYCLPASVEMIMRYYKVRVNQKDLGKIFNSDKSKGTYTSDMMKNFDGKKLKGFKIKRLYYTKNSEIEKLFEAYLSSSKLSKGKQKRFAKLMESKETADVLDEMDQKIVFNIFPKLRSELNKLFPELIKKYLDNGIPLLWSVIMNFDPEDRADGAHMRVVTGYRTGKSGEIEKIVYLDPWSNNKKTKDVDFDKAVAMTLEFFVILPENIAEKKDLR